MSQRIIAPTTYNFDPINECIYCGHRGELSDEHIIPYALGGTLVLPKSSCSPCAAITSRFERKVLRDFMHTGRAVGNMPSRRKSKRPKSLPIEFISPDETIFRRDVATPDAPAVIHLPILAPPSILSDRPPTNDIQFAGMETIHLGKDIRDVIQVNRAVGVRFHDRLLLSAFTQMLAKIAYSHVIATYGLLARDDSPVLPLIFGKRHEFSNWIGSGAFEPATKSENPLHVITSDDVTNDLGQRGYATRLRLFFNYPTTGYFVATHIPGWQAIF